jgi:peptide/nickel transport system substrate-binding protein
MREVSIALVRFICLLLCVCHAGNALAQPGGTPRKGGSAIFAITQDPATVNPVVSSNIPDRQIGCIVYQGLIEVTPDYKIVPLLAKSWTVSPDGLSYTFDLKNVKWHDGQPFTSADVKYSLLEANAKYSTIFAPAGKVIDSIETPAPDRVVIKLKRPFGPFMISLGCIQGGAILPEHVYRGTDVMTNPATTTKPIGTGPFKLTEWRHGDFIRLAKNNDYFEQGKPYLDEVIAKVITQASSRVQALKAGEIDMITSIPPNEVAGIRANPKLNVVPMDTPPNTSLAFFNTSRKPLDDKRVRHALFMATDREYILKNAFFNVGQVAVAPFTPDIHWAIDPAIDYNKMYPFDVAKANALLDEAGLKRGTDGRRFTVRIAVFATQQTELQQAALAMKSMWQAVGVDVIVEPLEDAVYLKKIYVDNDFDISIVSYTSYSDPALGIARTYVTGSIGRPYGNASRYSNPKIDELFAKGEEATDLSKRGSYYRQAQEILAEDLPVVQLRHYRDVAGQSKKLFELWGIVQGNGRWANAWIEP